MSYETLEQGGAGQARAHRSHKDFSAGGGASDNSSAGKKDENQSCNNHGQTNLQQPELEDL
jgi:hypothetical protein